MNRHEAEPQHPDPLLHRVIRDEPAYATPRPHIFFRVLLVSIPVVIIGIVVAFFAARHWAQRAMHDSLPKLDGTVSISGLSAPVTIQRDTHGVPHIRAASLDDLIIAQGYVTAQDRLWQMDTLRRFVSGDMAEIFGKSMIAHDALARTLRPRRQRFHGSPARAPPS
jgi:penicillin amidase